TLNKPLRAPNVSPSAKTIMDLRPAPPLKPSVPIPPIEATPPPPAPLVVAPPREPAKSESKNNKVPHPQPSPKQKETWLESIARSPIYKQELNELEVEALPDLSHLKSVPVPEPPATAELGGVNACIHFAPIVRTGQVIGGIFVILLAIAQLAGVGAAAFLGYL